ncbi:MAG TPA: hypothetical protein VFZ61_23805 [Polyangiales bacterium]
MRRSDRAAQRRAGVVRAALRHVGRALWRVMRVLALMMMALGPNYPPPPPPRPPPIEARAHSSDEDDEEP